MIWDYRVMVRVENGERQFGIYEVYYGPRGSVDGWTDEPVGPSGETLAELKRDLAFMRKALSAPVLGYKTGKEIKP